jgi:H+-transporting ATPase
MDWLDKIGREKRSRKDAKLEDFLTQVQRLTLTHENPENGQSEVFKFGTGNTPAEGNSQHTQAHGQEQKKKEDKRVDEGNNPPDTQKQEQDGKGESSEAPNPSQDMQKEKEEGSEVSKARKDVHKDDDESSNATKRDSHEHVREDPGARPHSELGHPIS